MKYTHRNLVSCFVVLLLILCQTANAQRQNNENVLRKLMIANMAITNLYVDTVNQEKLVEDAITGMLEKLDPHSTYVNAKEAKKLNEPLKGNFDGIGVQYNMLNDTLVVIQPVIDGPSEKVGIVAGDRIVTVNDTAIAGVKMSTEEIMSRLRGPKGTVVKLGVMRAGVSKMVYFNVKRDKIPVKSIDAVYMLRPGVGYVRIGNFGATTHAEFVEALATLQTQGMKDIVIDLQDNGGGYLNAAVDIANEMLEKNDLIVYTEGRVQNRYEFRAKGDGKFKVGKVVILTNEFTASAAEIVSGAVQDQDRGIIIGRRTFGKGLVQRPVDLPDGSLLRITVAHYYTPTGRCIQKPYTKGDKLAYQKDLDERYKHGEFTSADSIHFADSLKYSTIKKQRIVYGGGGIMPDVFVPLDTTLYTTFHRNIAARSIIVTENLRYMDSNRKALKKKYRTFEQFRDEYEVPQSYIDVILKEAEKQKLTPKDDDELKRTVAYMKPQLKALIARDLWTMSEYFAIWNEESNVIKAAVKYLETNTTQE